MIDPGSSPRVRGTQERQGAGGSAGRFIPACAGNTTRTSTCRDSRSVHPRVCGEHELKNLGRAPICGSSPRVRGTPSRELAPRAQFRFIPACAGNTGLNCHTPVHIPVHPRVCGEHVPRPPRTPCCAGSSPRVRGTPSPRLCDRFVRRFIPACAGNTLPPVAAAWPRSVHPRVCGEHVEVPVEGTVGFGSSPRVRGTRLR